MKVAIIHDTLNPCGGAERLALYMIKALRETGYDVDLISIEKTSWRRVQAIFKEDVRKYITDEVIVPPYRKIPSLYGRYVEWFFRDIFSYTVKLKDRYDILVATKQLHVPVFADILYMHFPDFYPGIQDLYYPERYVYNIFLRTYAMPSRLLSKFLVEMFRCIEYKPIILTNSSFSKALIKRWLKVDALVLHPPVDIERFRPKLTASDCERENTIVTIGRIERSKNLHMVPLIAKKVPSFNFLIVGASMQKEYLIYLHELIKKMEVASRVRILMNVDDSTLDDILLHARYYLHTTVYEHFGIAVVEAMAAGAIPIVHKKSGAWGDLLEWGKYGYGYESLDDIIKILEETSRREKFEGELHILVRKKACSFSYNFFKRKIRCVLNKIQEANERNRLRFFPL